MLRHLILIVLIGIFVTTQANASVTDEVKKTVDEVVKIVSSKEMKNDPPKRRQALRHAIGVIFDYGEMAKRSLGRHWNELTPAEKKHFTDLFETLLENSYADKIESYNNEKIEYIKETADDGHSEVKSRIVSPSKDEFSLDYRLMNKNGTWMVYDVVIEGVSLVSNYRSQFSRVISEKGYGELLKKLETKIRDIKAQ